MKKLFALICLIFLGHQIASANYRITKSASPDVVVTIKLNLHSKKQECLSGLGFCKISINITFEKNVRITEDMMSATAFINSRNQFVMKFDETQLQNYDNGSFMKYFDGKVSITLDDSYEVPGDVCKALGHPKSITIKEGTYPLILEQGSYKLTFDL